MPNNIASLKIAIDTGDMKKASLELDKMTKRGKQAEKGMFGLSRSVVALGASYLSLQAISSVTASFIRQADAMTLVDSRLKLATNSTEELATAQKELFGISQDTRTQISSTVDLYERVTRSLRDYNVEQKEVLGLTKIINQAMVVSGGTAESMNASIIQLGQAFSADFQSVGQELASIREQTPRLYQAILEGMGKTTKEFRKMAESGQLSSMMIVNAIKSQEKAVNEEFGLINKTVSQGETQFRNSSLAIIGSIDNITGATSSLADTLTGLSKVLDGLNVKINDYAANINNVHDIHKLKVISDATRELDQLKEAYTENINEGVGLFESTVSYNAEIKNQEFLITSVIRKIERLTKAEKDLKIEQSKKADGKTDLSIESDLLGFHESVNDLLREENALRAESIAIQEKLFNKVGGSEFSRTGGGGLLVLNDKNFDLAVKSASDKWYKSLSEADKKVWNDSVKNGEVATKSMAENLGELAKQNIGNALQDGMDGTLDLTSFTSQLSKAAGQALLFSGGLGSVAGVGLMAIGSLLGGGDEKSQAEIAQEEFDTFISGLDKASQALESFGNVGSSITNQIESLQMEMADVRESFISDFALWTTGDVGERFETAVAGTSGFDQNVTDVLVFRKLEEELANIISESLAETLDISALTTTQLEDLTKDIDVEAMKELGVELNNLALEAKIGGLGFKDTAEGIKNTTDATAILGNTLFANYIDNAEALDILNDKEQERLDVLEDSAKLQADIAAQVNQEMLGSLSYLNDIEKLSFANNLYRTAITPEDRVTSSRQIAEISRGTTRTKEDFIPVFTNYIDELKAQGEEATTQDVVDKLSDVVTAIEAQTDSATDDAKYA